jgi:hypothetical protein
MLLMANCENFLLVIFDYRPPRLRRSDNQTKMEPGGNPIIDKHKGSQRTMHQGKLIMRKQEQVKRY